MCRIFQCCRCVCQRILRVLMSRYWWMGNVLWCHERQVRIIHQYSPFPGMYSCTMFIESSSIRRNPPFSGVTCLRRSTVMGQSHSPHRLRSAVSHKSPCFSGPMNQLPAAALTRPQSSAGSVCNTAPISTTTSPTSVKGQRSRKRESSSASEQDGYEGIFGDKRRQPGVKRACNECRQQKVVWALMLRREGYTADESMGSYGATSLRNRCTRHVHDVSA